MISSFISNAKGLAKNPLGIIALFVSLIYGFACLVLGGTISNLHGNGERLPLIWFIIGFPIIILVAFVFLVTKHHEKLYSPSDYRADEAFIQTIDKEKIKERRLEEVKELVEAAPIENSDIVSKEASQYEIIDHPKEAALNDLTASSQELDKQIISIYKNAELWAAKELSLKYHVIFTNNITFSIGSGNIELDAYGTNERGIFIAEIKYWKVNKSYKNLKLSIQKFLSQHERLKAAFGKNQEFRLIVALVFDDLKRVDKSELLIFIKESYNGANVEFFDYEELRKSYENNSF